MTNREAQIFQWISENPMISQEELAAKAGIKRSSVAVHISNLMRKGYIKGKGYITNEPSYCTVVGGVNMDIGGTSYDDLVEKDSNPGSVRISLGGVGRNIAHNMRLLGIGVKMITALGDDLYAHRIVESCNDLGIDISDSLRSSSDPTSTYLYIAKPDGDMALAVSDMNIYRHLTPDFLDGKMYTINHGRMVVIDTNIPEDTIELIAEKSKIPVYADPVSGKKATRLLPVLNRLHTVTPNRMEAQILSGVEITDEVSMHKAADVLLNQGISQVFITLGEQGVYAANQEESILLPPFKSNLVNTTGAGDAFMAGLVLASTRHMNLHETTLVGLAAAGIATESKETMNADMSVNAIAKKAGLEM